jgi:hypothetical protein
MHCGYNTSNTVGRAGALRRAGEGDRYMLQVPAVLMGPELVRQARFKI